MRKLLTTATILVSRLGLAQTPDRPGWVLVEGALLKQDNATCVGTRLGFGLAAGSWVTPHWGWEGTYLHGEIKDKGGLWSAGEDHLDASALLAPWCRTGRWIPFLRGGLGGTRMESPLSLTGTSTTKGNLLLGAGTQVFFSPAALGVLEFRSVTVGTSSRRQEFQLVAGVGLRWGHSAAAAPALVPVTAPASDPVVAVPPPTKAEPAPLLSAPPPPATVELPPPPRVEPPPPPPARIVLDEAVLHFANGSNDLPPEGVEAVRKVAGSLSALKPGYTLLITGHTSSVGKASFNKALSKRRAEAVAMVLVDAGVAAASIQTLGAGPDRPLADNTTRAGQAHNRRVEIDVKMQGRDIEMGKNETPVAAPAPPSH